MNLSRYSKNSGLLGGQCNTPNQISLDLRKMKLMKMHLISPQKFGLLLQDKDFIVLHANPPPLLQ